uniref:Uncharacterized protein n=1 Tax=Candidatus Nitrotoga fabula TaxID=2182327 RepID=A0A2X0QVP5_9PROT|nr:protein of unknown function [Candidatus Nitrotoga fabula]
MISPPEFMADYRKCVYKDRIRILRDLKSESPFCDIKAGAVANRSAGKT